MAKITIDRDRFGDRGDEVMNYLSVSRPDEQEGEELEQPEARSDETEGITEFERSLDLYLQKKVKGNPGRYQKWITIGGHPGPEGQHEEGTPVQIGPQGKIEKGPKGIKGKDIDVIDKDVTGTEQDERKEAKLPKKKKEKLFGKSKARFSPLQSEQILGMLNEDLKTDYELEDIANLIGAPDDAIVTMTLNPATRFNEGFIAITFSGPETEGVFPYHADREIRRDENGDLYMANEVLVVDSKFQRQGIGRNVFGRQIENARELGIKYIEAFAVKSESMNGYSTWAKFGYDAEFVNIHNMPELPAEFSEVKTIQELMQKPGGAKWWTENGTAFNGRFDLDLDSVSSRAFGKYIEKKASKRKVA